MDIDLKTLAELSVIFYRISEDAREASEKLDLIVSNAELAPYGLAIGDRLLYTTEFRILTGLDKVPGWMNFLDEVVELKSLRVDENNLCYLRTESGGTPNIPLSLIQSMKAAAAERDLRWKSLHEQLADAHELHVLVGEGIATGEMVYLNSEDNQVYPYKAGAPSAYVAAADRPYKKGEEFVIHPNP